MIERLRLWDSNVLVYACVFLLVWLVSYISQCGDGNVAVYMNSPCFDLQRWVEDLDTGTAGMIEIICPLPALFCLSARASRARSCWCFG